MSIKTSTIRTMVLNEIENLSDELMAPTLKVIRSLKSDSLKFTLASNENLIESIILMSGCKLQDLWNLPEEDEAWQHL